MIDIRERMAELVSYLNVRTAEYNMGEPTISDEQWDNLYFELKELEKKYPNEVLETSPTQQVFFEEVDELEKVYHNHAMLSLDKTKEIDEVERFANKYDHAILMAKLDGLTISLTYRDGVLVSAETRGDGMKGENVFHNALVINGIPQYIPYADEVVIDGEVICRWNDFENIASDYKHPRNYAAGSLRLLNSAECKKRNLCFVAWDCIQGIEAEMLSEKLSELSLMGFDICPYYEYEKGKGQEIIDNIKGRMETLHYPIDGIVIKNDNCAEYRKEGETSHHPKAALAFKFYDEVYETNLRDIEWSLGRTGVITPIAIFDAIEIDNTTVQRANLHNYSVMQKALGEKPYEGEKILVTKRNMIIPNVEGSDWNEAEYRKSRPIEYIKCCPNCGGNIVIDTSDNDAAVVRCVNPSCSGLNLLHIKHFCSKQGLDIKGLSEATLKKLASYGWLNETFDLYNLWTHRDEWITKPGFGVTSVDKVLNAIEESRQCELYKFLNAIGIPLIGSKYTVDIAQRLRTYEEFRRLIKTGYDFCQWSMIGEERARSIMTFDYTEADALAENLDIINTYFETKNQRTKGTLAGVVFTITGKMQNFKNRDELKAFIEARGGTFSANMTNKTNYLINNDLSALTEKNKKAKAKNIPVINEEQFMKMAETGNYI